MSSNISSQEKLNHLLFTTRTIQSGGSAKYGYQKLLRKVNKLKRDLAILPPPPVGGMLDLGCGTHDPLGLATYFCLNGFEPAICCDLSWPRNEYFSGLSMYDIMANIRAFPNRYRFGGAPISEILARWKLFDVAQFEQGRLVEGLGSANGMVSYHVGDICDLAVPAESLSLVVSFAVMEHIEAIDAVNAWLYEKTAPGGLHYHFIDLADHRSYEANSQHGPLSFLTEQAEQRGVNRLRASEHLRSFENAGFEVVKARPRRHPLPDDIRARLVEPWASMSQDDLTTLKLTVILRKPTRS